MTQESDISQLRIEQYVLGELSPAQAAELEATLGTEVLEQKVAAIRASNADVLARMPPRVFAAAVDQRARVASGPQARWWMAAVPVAALLAVVAVGPQLVDQLDPDPGVEITRQKGVPSLHVYKQAAAGPEHLDRGDHASPGDVLQLSYAGAGAEFGAVVSIDGNGVVTWHLPRSGSRAVRLKSGTVPLDHSYELDDAPDYERFVFVTGPTDFDLREVENALYRWDGGDLSLDPMLSATVFAVDKAVR